MGEQRAWRGRVDNGPGGCQRAWPGGGGGGEYNGPGRAGLVRRAWQEGGGPGGGGEEEQCAWRGDNGPTIL